jgi:chlorobactene glucosyltransferase
VVQPHLFAVLAARYGSTERVSTATTPSEVIANGQCIFVAREAYEALGGHGAVREKVAEDLALAQRFVRKGRRIALVAGMDQLSTRMYTSLTEVVRGWTKNVFVAGREAVPGGRAMRALDPVTMLLAPLFELAPPAALGAGLLGLTSPLVLLWGFAGMLVTLPFWLAFYRFAELPLWYALLYPLGLLVVLYIVVAALVRGRRVVWKGRAYRVA